MNVVPRNVHCKSIIDFMKVKQNMHISITFVLQFHESNIVAKKFIETLSVVGIITMGSTGSNELVDFEKLPY